MSLLPSATFAACLAMVAGQAGAAQFSAEVRDAAGAVLADAVVWLEPTDGAPPKARGATAEIRQVGAEFVPRVTVVPTGARVDFPNMDKVKHHVYSFSPAKNFEIQLYSGKPEAPVVFDKPGLVTLGCNIHDWMLAYIQVVPTDYFGKTTEQGITRLPDAPAGRYVLHAWHPRQKAEPPVRPVELSAADRTALRLTIDVSPPQPETPRPARGDTY